MVDSNEGAVSARCVYISRNQLLSQMRSSGPGLHSAVASPQRYRYVRLYFDFNMSICRLVLSLVSNSRCQGEVQMRWVERS